jgi:hypothetical protein
VCTARPWCGLLSPGRLSGEVADPAFSRAFFAIWLDSRTRVPALRSRLLGPPLERRPTRLLGLRYGLLGLPLAFAALPIYVHVPKLYADQAGLSLALVGRILLLTRVVDALSDP